LSAVALVLLWAAMVPAQMFSITALACGQPSTTLPEGASGIAAQYPGDQGIDEDSRVLFVEDFAETSLDEVAKNWESVQDRNTMSLVEDIPDGSHDQQSLRITHVGGRGTGGQIYRRLPEGHQRLFARWYVKFDRDCAQIHHFGTHLGGFHPSTPWPQGGAGERPDGSKRFTTGVEPYGDSWTWDFYSYWQGMRIHGDGNYWGTPFLQGAPKPAVTKDAWICVELMVKLNDPVTASNGEQAFWIDGKLWRVDGQVVSHIGPGFPKGNWTGGWWRPDAESRSDFDGFNWRSIDALTINYLWTYVYITKAPRGHISRVGFDNIVVATDYIGPISSR
jgi:hypothetical protein